jgi:hypothetical protein
MSNENTMTETPVISAVLHRLNKSALLTVAQLEDLLNLAERSGYPYLSTTDLRFSQYRTLFRRCGSEAVQRELLAALIDGTNWVCEPLAATQDVNGDGVVDTDDVLDGVVDASSSVAAALVIAKGDLVNGSRRISEEHATTLLAAVNKSLASLLAVRQAVSFLSEPARRSA